MADLNKKLSENIDGNFFIDSTCIDCATCRNLVPEIYKESSEHSIVYRQPKNEKEYKRASQALLCCPTGSIGTLNKIENLKEIMSEFPLQIEDNIYYCGFTSPKSFGARSYFIKHKDGNWLIDSPKYLPQLVSSFEKHGGIKYIFLTHRDDVADADKYAKYFSSKRLIHEFELNSQPESELIIKGYKIDNFTNDFTIIPVPGHTKGHCALLYKNKYLFSGDHVWWNKNINHLSASKGVCWYSWSEQIKSMELLIDFDFEWILPGHGDKINYTVDVMKQQLKELSENMKSR